ncbi:MAG: hypothetical protein AAB336_00240 [Acidobacteriota bacterium]
MTGSAVEHLGQLKVWIAAEVWIRVKLVLLHLPQNFTPSANLAPQRVQATIPGITLDCPALLLLSCDGDGWLPPPNGFN